MTTLVLPASLLLVTMLAMLNLPQSTLAHELCVNAQSPVFSSLDYCSEYSSALNPDMRTCCAGSGASDNSVRQTVESFEPIVSDKCRSILKQIECSHCDPWSAHLFESERPGAPVKPVSTLCSTYCEKVFLACSSQPVSRSPFEANSPRQFTAEETITDVFGDAVAFCEIFTKTVTGESAYCNPGKPFDINEALSSTLLSGSASLCMERLLATDMHDRRYLNMVHYPVVGKEDYVLLGSSNGIIDLYQIRENEMMLHHGIFLDLRTKMVTDAERGLLGMAFHPNFQANGRFFTTYTCAASAEDCSEDGALTVYEYYFDPVNTKNPEWLMAPVSYRKVIDFVGVPREANNHNGGQIQFAPWPKLDPLMYIVTGDTGTDGMPSQDMNSLIGKMLRINVDTGFNPSNGETYGIPSDNPWADVSGVRGELFATGLRNVWRCSVDVRSSNETHDVLMCGDVGHDHWEEFNKVEAGQNYGWPRYEGTHDFYTHFRLEGTTPPVIEYSHETFGGIGAAIGGYFYEDKYNNAHLRGRYISSDLFGQLLVSTVQPDGSFDMDYLGFKCSPNSPLECTDASAWQMWRRNVLGFSEGLLDQQLYIVSGAGIFRVVDAEKCLQPTPPEKVYCGINSFSEGRCGLPEFASAGCLAGDCCSSGGYCGRSEAHCGTGSLCVSTDPDYEPAPDAVNLVIPRDVAPPTLQNLPPIPDDLYAQASKARDTTTTQAPASTNGGPTSTPTNTDGVPPSSSDALLQTTNAPEDQAKDDIDESQRQPGSQSAGYKVSDVHTVLIVSLLSIILGDILGLY